MEERPDQNDVILASLSPRRAALLRQIGLRFAIVSGDVVEPRWSGEKPEDYVAAMATLKAAATKTIIHADAARHYEGVADLPLIAADTVVVIDGEVLGKPQDEDDGVTMLMTLAGRQHRVLTGVEILFAGQVCRCVVETAVNVRPLTEQDCRRYWLTGEPADKAGAYGIQGVGAVFVTGIEGSYTNVVGLPLVETAQLLKACGIDILGRATTASVRRAEERTNV